MTNNLFKIKYKPYYFYSFVENEWIYNKNIINENDIITRINDLTDELLTRSILPAPSIGMPIKVIASSLDDALAMASALELIKRNFFNQFDNSTKEKQTSLVKENFHVYFIDNKRTIIWKELVEEI